MIVVINGPGGAGKDEFIHCCKFLLSDKAQVHNFSLITPVKRLWSDKQYEKTPEYRVLLEQTLLNWMQFNSEPLNILFEQVDNVLRQNEPHLIFCHIRQGEFIRRFMDRYPEAITLHLDSNRCQDFLTDADRNTKFYGYDFELRNDGSKPELMQAAHHFLSQIDIY